MGIGDTSDVHQRRWTAIATFAASARADAIESLLRLAFQTKQQPDAAFLSGMRDAVRQADPPAVSPNDHQLTVLAATALVIIMNASTTLAARAALSITTTAGYGRATPDLPMDLAALASARLAIIANRLRDRTPLARVETVPSVDIDGTAGKIKEAGWTNNWQPVADAFASLKAPIDSAFDAIVKAQNTFVRTLSQTLAMQDEELNMLWWLFNGYSNDFQMPFHDVPRQRRSLLYAKELADLTSILPGPSSAQALLSRAGLDGDQETIATVINEAPLSWSRPLVEKAPLSPVSMPLHFGIARAAETGPGNDWIANWNAVTELDANAPIQSLSISTLFYRERLLVRSV